MGLGRIRPPPQPWAEGTGTHLDDDSGTEFLAEVADGDVHQVVHLPKVALHGDLVPAPAVHDCGDGAGVALAEPGPPGIAHHPGGLQGAEMEPPHGGRTGQGAHTSPTLDDVADDLELHGQAEEVVDEGHDHLGHANLVIGTEPVPAALHAQLDDIWGGGQEPSAAHAPPAPLAPAPSGVPCEASAGQGAAAAPSPGQQPPARRCQPPARPAHRHSAVWFSSHKAPGCWGPPGAPGPGAAACCTPPRWPPPRSAPRRRVRCSASRCPASARSAAGGQAATWAQAPAPHRPPRPSPPTSPPCPPSLCAGGPLTPARGGGCG